MKKILLLWIICLGMIAQVEAQVKTALQPLDLFDMEYVTEPSISPEQSGICP
jgi:acylaminoacyl-peptidase